jgi:hypothetical protein
VAPYHPWFRSEIGLNLVYTQAVGTQGIIKYQLVPIDSNYYSLPLGRMARTEAPITRNAGPAARTSVARGGLWRNPSDERDVVRS